MQPREVGFGAVILAAIPTRFAVMTDIEHGLNAYAISNFPRVHASRTNLDNNTSSLVARTLDSKFRHLGHRPVIEHVVNVRHTKAGDIEPYEKLIIL